MSLHPAAGGGEQPRIGDQIDVLCDRFEADLRAGKAPRIEDLLAGVPDSARGGLLRELVWVEIYLARRVGQPVDFQRYSERFPDDAPVIEEIRTEFESQSDRPGDLSSLPQEASSDTVSDRPSLPSQIRQFKLLSIIGEGGFGTVWRAFDTKLQRDVAVKIPRINRFARVDIAEVLQEARAAAPLRHANIVSVHEVSEGSEDSPPFIVTDLIDGPNLKKCLETDRFTSRQIAVLLSKIARGLEHAHGRDIIHRDLKPANVLLDRQREPHLADFGLAKRLTSAGPETGDGQLIGTPAYMSPEQARGDQSAVDHRTDIYSLGVMLYELLTGQPPFRGDLSSLLGQIQNSEPAPPSQLQPGIPEDLESLCLKCLKKYPALRYQSAAALADDLQRFLDGELLQGVPVRFSRKAKRWTQRHRRFVLGILATVTVCGGFALGLWWWSLPPRRLVEFTTDPPGCEITVVKMDPLTGEPDPDQIEHARGKTPLLMRLRPGDYMVIADLDKTRFHEVPRRVPEFGEGKKLLHSSRFWKIGSDGITRFFGPIKIPRTSHDGLILVEGRSDWDSSNGERNSRTLLQVPPLLVEKYEHTASLESPAADARLRRNDYFSAERYAESRGMRLPTSLELQYVIQQQRKIQPNHQSDAQILHGLSDNPWEWTITKMGAGGIRGASRVLRCGEPTPEPASPNSGSLFDLIRLAEEADAESEFGVRCVRSPHPRLRKKDFMRR